jgi:hypothetical protein
VKFDRESIPANFRIDPEQLEKHEGQKIDQDKAVAARERFFMEEACDYGDEIVKFASLRLVKYTPEQIVWGFCVGLYCLRRDYPGAAQAFDDIVERAGKELKVTATGAITDEAEIKKIQDGIVPFTEEEERVAVQFAEVFLQYISRSRKQTGVSEGQTVYGLGRSFHNLRLTYPKEKGGTAAFDTYARKAGNYYQTNKETL